MESNIINIATLTIDKTEANNSIEQTKKQIFDLQKANSDLRKDILKNGDASGEQTKKFVENEQALKQLNAQYRTQSAAINDLTLAELKSNKALSETAKSLDQAKAQNKELATLRGQVNATTTEGVKAIELLNAKIDANNKLINDNSSKLEQQKNNVGNYGSISKELNETLSKQGGIYNTVRTQVQGFQSTVSGAISTVKDINNSVVGAAQGIIGFANASKLAATQTATMAATETAAAAATEGLAAAETTAAVATDGLAAAETTATVATGAFSAVLGTLLFPITALIAVGLLLYSVFKDFSPLINPVKDAFAALGAVFTVLKTGILDVVTGARSLGDVFSSLGSDIADATVETYKLEGAQRALTKAMDIQEVASARTATKVKELVLQSKDLSKTVQERTALLNKAQVLEEKEFQNRFKNYKKEKDLLVDRLAVGKNLSEEDRKRLIAGDYEYLKSIAKKKKLDSDLVEAYKKNQLSREQLLQEDNQIQEKAQNYKNKIIEKYQASQERAAEKAAEAEKKRIEDAEKARIKTLNDGLIAFELEKNSVDEQLKFYTDYYAKLNELQGGTERIANANALSQKVLSIAEETLKGEIDAQKKAFEEKKNISETEKNDLIANAQFLRDTEIKRVNESILSERDKAIALEEIQKGYLDSITIINANYDAAEKDRQARRLQEEKTLADAAFQLKLLALEEQGLAELELQKAQNDLKLEETKRLIDEDLALQKISATEAAALKNVEEKKYASANKKINKEIANAREATNVQMVKDSLTALNAIFGENKATAVAAALVNTYEGISAGVKLGYPAAIPAVAAAAATGFAAVKNILSTKKGDTGGGGASSSTGVQAAPSIFENPARTQTIATVNAPPPQETTPTVQPVLVLESLDEVKNGQQIKIKSGGN